MSKTPNDPTPTPTPADPTNETPATPAADPAPAQEPEQADEAARLRSELDKARKWEARAKENFEKAQKYDALEEASKTEAQKQADALAKAEAKVAEYETREQVAKWKDEVVDATELPADKKAKLRTALAGSTKEEIEAHAEILQSFIGSDPQEQEKPGTVSTIGKVPASAPNIPLGEQIAAAEHERDSATPQTAEWKSAQQRVMDLKGMQLFEVAQAK